MILSAAPVKFNYGYDNSISLNNGVVYTFDNLFFNNNPLLASI